MKKEKGRYERPSLQRIFNGPQFTTLGRPYLPIPFSAAFERLCARALVHGYLGFDYADEITLARLFARIEERRRA